MGRLKRVLGAVALVCLCAAAAWGGGRIRLATTTSTENSGLLAAILPVFERTSGYRVDVIAVGTGQALRLGRGCDVDVVLVHAPALEKAFVAQGWGVRREGVMYNYFAIVGPPSDPAGIKGLSPVEAMKRIAETKAMFVSRGDNSGTHVKELSLWKAAGIKPKGRWYREAGAGMGAVLRMASELGAYTLTDTGTFYKYRCAGRLNLVALVAGGQALRNPYHIIAINPAKCPGVNSAGAEALIKFMTSRKGKRLIANYRACGHKLFWPLP